MKKILIAATMVVLLASSLFAGGGSDEEFEYVEGNVIIQTSEYMEVLQREPNLVTDQTWFNDMIPVWDITDVRQIAEKVIPDEHLSDFLFYTVVFDTVHTVQEVQDAFAVKQEVLSANPNHLAKLDGINTDDEYADDMWALEKIGMNEVWSELGEYGSEDVVVAVIDTGIDLGIIPENPAMEIHEDLIENLWINEDEIPGNGLDDDGNGIIDDIYGYNPFFDHTLAVDEDETIPQDLFGHGTHVIGTIAATTNNGTGVAGVAGGWYEQGNEHSGCKVMVIRNGGTRVYEVLPKDVSIEGLMYAYYNEAQIINMSWRLPDSPELYDCIYDIANDVDDIYEDGFEPILVAAAGNGGGEYMSYPAGYDEVISVGATTILDHKAVYSQYGDPYINVCAPGGEEINTVNSVKSTMPFDNLFYFYGVYGSQYAGAYGTSIASPHVAGVIALMKSHFPAMQNDEIFEKLYGTCDNLLGCTPLNTGKMGAGRINAYKALTDGPFTNFAIHEITFDGLPYIQAGTTNIEVNILLKNWWEPNISITSEFLCEPEDNIQIVEDNASWGVIGQYEIVANNGNLVISDQSGELREIEFELYLTIETQTGTLYETIPIVVEVKADIGGPNEEVTTDFTIDDIDNDGLDEIAFGTTYESQSELYGIVYIYNNGSFITMQTEEPIKAKIAFADLDNDEVKEIIVADEENIYIYNNTGFELYSHSINITGSKIISFAVEDLTNDGQLEIVLNHTTGLIVYYGEFPDPQTYYHYVGENILSELAVANVDIDPKKDVIFLFHDTQDQDILKLMKFNIELPPRGPIGTLKSTNIGDPPSPDFFHSYKVSNVILIKRVYDPYLYPYHSIFFGRNIICSEGTELSSDYDTFCFEYVGVTGSEIWSVEYTSGTQPDSVIDPGKLIAGDFLDGGDYEDGIELITSADELIINIEGDRHTINNHIHGHVYEIELLGGFILLKYRPAIITNMTNHQNGNVFIFKENIIKVYDANKSHLSNLSITLPDTDEIVSLAFGSTFNSSYKDLYYITKDGQLSRSYISSADNLLCEWSQFQNNSRNTASYYQPLPEEIDENITLKHDAVIDKKTKVLSQSTLSIDDGIEIRFEKDKQLNIFGNLMCIGTENNSINISGLCSNETRKYWYGINFYRYSSSEIEYTTIQNAYDGIQYNGCNDHILQNNSIIDNYIGVGFYCSSFEVNTNNFSNNQYGVCCDKFASPLFGYPGIPNPDIGHNGIFNNDIGVFISMASPSFQDGFNDICSNDILNMKYNVECPGFQIAAQNNWWGSNIENQIIEYLDPVENFIYDPWCDSPQTSFLSRGDSLSVFQLACINLYEELYFPAIDLFQQVIDDSTNTYEDFLSLSYMFICYTELNIINDFGIYLDGLLSSQQTDEFTKCLLHNKGMTYRAMENFDGAICLYEDIILNHPSYIDSCYAVIDIGNTYLESNGRASGRLMHLHPESFESHLYTTQLLLESIRTGNHIQNNIPQVKKCVLHKNYPNPFNPETTISFSIPEDSKVELSIYNIRGQKVRTLIKNEFEKGFHRVIWNSKDNNGKPVATGVYFYKLKVNGKDKAVKKMLLLK